jgi:uncharacterized surface protein with fasciclin (FAS1) repeats
MDARAVSSAEADPEPMQDRSPAGPVVDALRTLDRQDRSNREEIHMRTKLIAGLAAVALVGALAACSGDDESASTSPMPVEAAASASSAMDDMGMTVTDIVAANPDFSTLLAAVQAAGLGDTLAGEGPYTVFAPTDDAFAAVPAGTLAKLLKPANQDQLAAILTYHVVPGEVMAADVMPGDVTTVNGADFTISVEDGDVLITDGQGNQAMVTQTDIAATNGVIHVIDAVLLPPAQ